MMAPMLQHRDLKRAGGLSDAQALALVKLFDSGLAVGMKTQQTLQAAWVGFLGLR